MQNGIEYEFFMSRFQHLRDIKENDKIKISLVFYEGIGSACVLKICKKRDLSEVCRRLAEVRHPNVAVVYDWFFDGKDTYILEEFLHGTTLGQQLEQGEVFAEKETVKIISEVCNGLEVLHGQKPPVVHNDITTSNIMICEDQTIKLFDFDISRTYKDGADKNTRLFGTEEYAAPEHYGYGQSEPRTDIYSLGVVMHEMLTGKPLATDHKMIYKGKLKKIIGKCIEISPKNRYDSARQLRMALEGKGQKKTILFLGTGMLLLGLGIMTVVFLGPKMKALFSPDMNPEQLSVNSRVEDAIEAGDEEILIATPSEEEAAVSEVTPQETVADETQESEENASNLPKGSMETVDSVNGKLYSMVALNDGTFVSLEGQKDAFLLKFSNGTTVQIEGVGGFYGVKLCYNSYEDRLYLLEFAGYQLNVFEVHKDYTLEHKTSIEKVFSVERPEAACNFFADGKLLVNQMGAVIDIEAGTVLGNAPKGSYVIGDTLFKKGAENVFQEIDFEENVLREVSFTEGEANPKDAKLYIDGSYGYFIGSVQESENIFKDYVYCFDGKKYEPIISLNDYKYYSSFDFDHLCVTKEAVRCYDKHTNTIKEFKLN